MLIARRPLLWGLCLSVLGTCAAARDTQTAIEVVPPDGKADDAATSSSPGRMAAANG